MKYYQKLLLSLVLNIILGVSVNLHAQENQQKNNEIQNEIQLDKSNNMLLRHTGFLKLKQATWNNDTTVTVEFNVMLKEARTGETISLYELTDALTLTSEKQSYPEEGKFLHFTDSIKNVDNEGFERPLKIQFRNISIDFLNKTIKGDIKAWVAMTIGNNEVADYPEFYSKEGFELGEPKID